MKPTELDQEIERFNDALTDMFAAFDRVIGQINTDLKETRAIMKELTEHA